MLDYDNAYTLFLIDSNLMTLQNLKHNGKTINFEEAYEVFTYNTENKTYAAKDVEVLIGYSVSNGGNSISICDCIYEAANIEIMFSQDSFTMKFIFEEYSSLATFKDFNTTEINLSEKHQQALNSQE